MEVASHKEHTLGNISLCGQLKIPGWILPKTVFTGTENAHKEMFQWNEALMRQTVVRYITKYPLRQVIIKIFSCSTQHVTWLTAVHGAHIEQQTFHSKTTRFPQRDKHFLP